MQKPILEQAEEWREIAGYENYRVSNHGRVMSLGRTQYVPTGFKYETRTKILTPAKNSSGYPHLKLFDGLRTKRSTVHRLVAEAFIPNPDGKRTINHKNGIKTDNRADNLEWNTHGENMRHSYTHLGRIGSLSGVVGINHPISKPVDKLSVSGEFIESFESGNIAGIATGVSRQAICEACRGRVRLSGGFRWRYTDERPATQIMARFHIKGESK